MSKKVDDKIVVLDDNHPLVEYIRAFKWGTLLDYGLVTVQIREGIPRLLTIQLTHKLD